MPAVASFALGGKIDGPGKPKAAAAAADVESGAVCKRMSESTEEDVSSPFELGRMHTIDGTPEQWYECTEPSALDPTINCMLAPEWMGLEEGTWLCTDALKSEDKLTVDSYGENSY